MDPIHPLDAPPPVNHRALFSVLIVVVVGFLAYQYVLPKSRLDFNRGDAAVSGVTLSVQSTTTSVVLNNQFTVDVVLNTGTATVTAADIRISFPQNTLQPISITGGSFLPSVLSPGTIGSGTASIVVGSGTAGRQGMGTVAMITFRAVQIGTATIQVDATSQVAAVGEPVNVLTIRTPLTMTVANNPPTAELSASPLAIKTGLLVPVSLAPSRLTWSTTNATAASIDQGVGTVQLSGTKDVAPSTTTTYTLTVSNSSSSITRTVTVQVSKIGDIVAPVNTIDIFDYNAFVTAFINNSSSADLDADGDMDLFDYNIIVTNFGR